MRKVLKRLILLTIFVFSTNVYAWEQDNFIIMSFLDPLMSPDRNANKRWFKELAEAHFNMMTGFTSGWNGGQNSHDFAEMQERLFLIDEVVQENGHIDDLKMFITDHYVYRNTDIDWGVFLYEGFLGSGMQYPELMPYIYGYNIIHEPNLDELDLAREMIRGVFNSSDNTYNRIPLIVLHSNRVGDFCGLEWSASERRMVVDIDEDEYRDYIEYILESGTPTEKVKLISFDNYPFVTNANMRYVRSTSNPYDYLQMKNGYFLNYQIVAEETKKKGASFFAFAYAAQETMYENSSREYPNIEHDGPQDYSAFYLPNTNFEAVAEAQMRFTAHVPILYGARGIAWYTYTQGWDYGRVEMKTGLVKRPDESNPNPSDVTPTVLYPIAQEINRVLKNLGPKLMDLQWIGTYHGSSHNNIRTTHPYRVPDWNNYRQQYYSDNPEKYLPTVNSYTPVISSIATDHRSDEFAAGVLWHPYERKYYVIVLNKAMDLSRNQGDRTFAVYFKNNVYSVEHYDKSGSGNWIQQWDSSKAVFGIEPGDIEVFRVSSW